MKTAAIYARVSSDQQKEENTIASQTAALVDFARREGYTVADEWVFQDEGYSGANLARPGLERVRDLAAEGQIQAVLVLSPDRLSRKYAYQVLLIEELGRCGVEVIFVHAPAASDRAEDQLLLQFQGMIAEYERAQILERSRRGKRHRARQGEVSVLSGAPYGYRYVRKHDDQPAGYEIMAAEARVVRQVFQWYTQAPLSIGAITRRLNDEGVPTRKGGSRWDRSTVWAMLRNPAYCGRACFGKTRLAPRQRLNNRARRLRGTLSARCGANQELPREQWIEIAVPALVSDETFALAQERLQSNKKHSPRRTHTPSLLQGLVHCHQCGYAFYRSSTRTTARTIYYYRCLGSDAWRYGGQARCSQRPIRLDLLEHTVWTQVLHLLEDPGLIESEIDRRLQAARDAYPAKRQQDSLTRELAKIRNSTDRLLTAYQEELLSLAELRRRMPALRQREKQVTEELESLKAQLADRTAYLQLAQTLSAFLQRLRANAQSLDVEQCQRITRLLVKEVIVATDSITIRHSIPMHGGDRHGGDNPPLGSAATPLRASSEQSSLLRPWRDFAAAREHLPALCAGPMVQERGAPAT